jgi:hypothetical protein
MGEMSEYYGDDTWGAETIRAMRTRDKEVAETKRQMESPEYWHSKNGRLTAIVDMDDKHLMNTILFLLRGGIAGVVDAVERKEHSSDAQLIYATELRMLGFRELTVQRYKNLVAEQERREKKKADEEDEADDSDEGTG